MRVSVRRGGDGRDGGDGGGGRSDAALPQWGTGLPGEDRVLQMRFGEEVEARGRQGSDGGLHGGSEGHEDEAVGWGY